MAAVPVPAWLQVAEEGLELLADGMAVAIGHLCLGHRCVYVHRTTAMAVLLGALLLVEREGVY
jgi:hypothetical protein